MCMLSSKMYGFMAVYGKVSTQMQEIGKQKASLLIQAEIQKNKSQRKPKKLVTRDKRDSSN